MAQSTFLEPEPNAYYFHLAGAPLGEGSIILPGNWGRIVRAAGWGHSSAVRELAIEAARLERFDTRPSRFDCLFAFPVEAEARWFRDNANGFRWHHLFRVRLKTPSAVSFIANANSLPPNVPFAPQWPDSYWMGVAVDTASGAPIEKGVTEGGILCRELLTLSPLVVEERLD